MKKVGDYYEYQGCVHIHTIDSDGTKSVEEVAEIASSTGLDFILVSDHMTLKSREENREGFYNDTLVLIGYEHNDPDDCNHYLLFETKDVLPGNMTAREYVTEGQRQGALGIIAHPDEIRPMDGKYRSYPWTEWDVDGYDAIEIWNQMSEWMENLKPYNQLKMLFSPRKFMRSPTDRILRKWDEVNRTRKVAGLSAADVHAFPYKIGPFRVTIFPYKVQLKSLRSHLLLPDLLSKDVDKARLQVYDAIRDCRAFISNYRWGDASGFDFSAIKGSTNIVSGGYLESYEDCLIRVNCPDYAKIRLICDSERIVEAFGNSLEYKPVKNGLYRVEVHRGNRGWIYSNHIRIGI